MNISNIVISKWRDYGTALRLIKPGCFMGSVDLSDAYYSVNVTNNDRKYLRFLWRGKLYQYTCLPNGLSSAPRLFTKLLKPVYALLRSQRSCFSSIY